MNIKKNGLEFEKIVADIQAQVDPTVVCCFTL